jgi:transcriptional regulator with XRE-family HTH domain
MSSGGLTSYSELAGVLDQLPRVCKEKRRREALSLREAAKQMGLSFSVVTRFENGTGVHLDSAKAVLHWLDGKVAS